MKTGIILLWAIGLMSGGHESGSAEFPSIQACNMARVQLVLAQDERPEVSAHHIQCLTWKFESREA